MIDSADALAAYAVRAARADSLALDTEFMREKTYRAELCLVQVADSEGAVCIDPLAVPDFGARSAPAHRCGHRPRSPPRTS